MPANISANKFSLQKARHSAPAGALKSVPQENRSNFPRENRPLPNARSFPQEKRPISNLQNAQTALKQVRSNDNQKKIQEVRELAKLAAGATTPLGQAKIALKGAKLAGSLMKYIEPTIDWLVGIAFSFALLKDLIDLVGIGSLPLIGTIITFMVSSIIFLTMFLAGANGKMNVVKNTMKRAAVIAIGTGFEMFTGPNIMPVETITVIIAFVLVLIDRKKEAESAPQQ